MQPSARRGVSGQMRWAALVLAACGSTTTTVTPIYVGPGMRPYERTVDVLLAPPTRPHIDRDLIHVAAAPRGTPDRQLVEQLRSTAAYAGCDAVYVVAILGRTSFESIVGDCIKWQ